MNHAVSKLLKRAEAIPYTTETLVVTLLLVSSIRLTEEWLLGEFSQPRWGLIVHSLSFYLAIFMLNANNLTVVLGRELRSHFGIVVVGLWIAVLPPLFDLFNPNRDAEGYTYFLSFSWSLFADYQATGESLALWLWIAAFGYYTWFASHSVRKVAAALALTYLTIQGMGWLSYLLVEWIRTAADLPREQVHLLFSVLWLIVSMSVITLRRRNSYRNALARVHHALPWGVLALLGAKLSGSAIEPLHYVVALLCAASFLLILMANDYYDQDLDALGGRRSPMDREDLELVYIFQALIIGIGAAITGLTALMLFLFFLLSHLYHAPRFRFKRHYLGSSVIEGAGAIVCMLAGVAVTEYAQREQFPALVAIIGLGFMAASNFKDYKDHESDRRYGVHTLYVDLLLRGWSLSAANRLVAALLWWVLASGCGVLLLVGVSPQALIPLAAASFLPPVLLLRGDTPKAAVRGCIWATVLFLALAVTLIPSA